MARITGMGVVIPAITATTGTTTTITAITMPWAIFLSIITATVTAAIVIMVITTTIIVIMAITQSIIMFMDTTITPTESIQSQSALCGTLADCKQCVPLILQ